MNILVINSGSSSIKAAVIAANTGKRHLEFKIERIQEKQPILTWNEEKKQIFCPETGHEAALAWVLPQVINKLDGKQLHAIGHRVVHGGEQFDQPTLIDATVEKAIEELCALAPLHNPPQLLGIRIAKKVFADLPHIAVFDTAFHQTLPKRALTYALPKEIRDKHNLRRYGFHGTSHEFVAYKAADFLQTDIRNLRIITCHLGSGCSITAVEYGRSVETSMGMTPLEGLVMGTRSGDIDAGILFHVAEAEGWDIEQLNKMLNKSSGLLGLSGVGSDMRDIIQKATEGNDDCRLALQVFTHRLRKYIGAYAAVMGGVDAIVFTGGIGENSPVIRHRSTQRLDFIGAVIDEDKNHDIRLTVEQDVQLFSAEQSRVKMLAIKTDEQLAIAQDCMQVLKETGVNQVPTIPIAVSARHIHLTQDVVDQLFGKGYELTVRAPLSQPGQFASNETVAVVGPKNTLNKVRILGPCRHINQVEISRTDEFFLGVDAPVRASGKIKNTPGIKLVGPKGEVTLTHGVICAWRHIHMTPEDADIFGVEDKDIVEVEVNAGSRPLTFGNVLVRVSPKYKLEMHIDTDEANAAELPSRSEGVLIGTEGVATLIKKKIKHI